MTSSDDQLAVRATILLGELLHMVIIKHVTHLFIYSIVWHPEIEHVEDEASHKCLCHGRVNIA